MSADIKSAATFHSWLLYVHSSFPVGETMHPQQVFFAIALLFISTSCIAQPNSRDTARRGPIFHLIGGPNRDLDTLYPQSYKGMMYVTNLGDDTLRILRLRNSGANILATLKDGVIAPGDTGSIEVIGEFRSRMGLSVKSCIIETNDPENPAYNVKFRVVVRPYIEVEPASGYFFLNDRRKVGGGWDTTMVLRSAYDTTILLYPAIVQQSFPGITITTDLTDTVALKFREERRVRIQMQKEQAILNGTAMGQIFFPINLPSSINCSLYYYED